MLREMVTEKMLKSILQEGEYRFKRFVDHVYECMPEHNRPKRKGMTAQTAVIETFLNSLSDDRFFEFMETYYIYKFAQR